jgi:hypothetical protein
MVSNWISRIFLAAGVAALALSLMPRAHAQECFSGSEIDAPTAKALESAAQQYYDMSAQGDVAGLRTNAVPDVAASFGGIEQAVVSHKVYFAQGPAADTRIFLLDATNSKTNWQRADFYCGIYNSPGRIGISIPNLPPGRYALTIARVAAKEPATLTLVLAEAGRNTWKLAGYYARANALGGHDGQWFLSTAREYKQKGETHNAWFYYLTAWDLMAPVDFVSTPTLDKLSDELQASRPADLPSPETPMQLAAGGKTFKVVDLSAVPVGTELYVRVQYDSTSVGNPATASQDNAAIIKALLGKYPEMREAFGGVIARATDGSGHEYVTLTAMKDTK